MAGKPRGGVGGRSWLNIRVRAEPSKMRYLAATVAEAPIEAGERYFQTLQSVAAAAADVMRQYLLEPVNYTPTGQKRKASGKGVAGRYETGEMYDKISWRVTKATKTSYRVELGWINGTPGYSIFQEYGTKNGIQGMHALRYAAEFARKEMKLRGFSGDAFALPPNSFTDRD